MKLIVIIAVMTVVNTVIYRNKIRDDNLLMQKIITKRYQCIEFPCGISVTFIASFS